MVSYRIRVELDGITPPIWRELRVQDDMPLPLLHRVLQEAMGWHDAHMHAFVREDAFGGSHVWQPGPEEDDFQEGPAVQDESDATVSDLLHRVGARATYVYDFGDRWEHTLTVVGEAEHDDGVRLLAGERACPPEDCGGVPGYQQLVEILITLARNPQAVVDPWDAERVHHTFGDREPADILADLDDFDVLTADGRVQAVATPVPSLIARLSETVRQSEEHGSRLLTRMVELARLDQATAPPAQVRADMMEPITWFLKRMGDGLSLTSAGYLRPIDVDAVAEKLNLRDEWTGTFNREVQTPQVANFREALQALGLVRKYKGRLCPTAVGERLADDPDGLWHAVAEALPLDRGDFAEVAGVVIMLDLAGQTAAAHHVVEEYRAMPPAERTEQLQAIRREADARLEHAISAAGWRTDDGDVPAEHIRYDARLTMTVLDRCGVIPRFGHEQLWAPTEGGQQLLRAALRGPADSHGSP